MNQIYNYFILARPKQWLKNILIFAALIFAKKFTNIPSILQTIYGFIAFSFAASALYCLNDIIDSHSDANHPIKCKRPIAAGVVKKYSAIIFAAILLITSI